MKMNKKVLSILAVLALICTMFSNYRVVKAQEEVDLNFRVDPSNNYVCYDIPDFGTEIVKRVTLKTLDGQTLVNRYSGFPGDDYSVIKMLQIGASREDLAKGKINEDGTGTYQYIIEILEKSNQSNILKTYESQYIKYYIDENDKDILEVVKPINSLDLTIEKPEVGSKNKIIEVDLGGWGYITGSNNPVVEMQPDSHVQLEESNWINGGATPEDYGYYDIFEGTFEDGKVYYAQLYLTPESGYFYTEDVDIKVNGKTPEYVDFYLDELACVVVKIYAGEEPEYLKGDLDGNNVIDANDASIALEIYKAENATQEDIQIGDMDNNNLIDANDASLILELYKTNN